MKSSTTSVSIRTCLVARSTVSPLRAPTSCDVCAGGLSTMTNPSCKNATLQRREDAPYDDVGRVVAREAGREPVTSAALTLGDLADVDRAERAQADAPGAVGGLLE